MKVKYIAPSTNIKPLQLSNLMGTSTGSVSISDTSLENAVKSGEIPSHTGSDGSTIIDIDAKQGTFDSDGASNVWE